MSMHDCTMDWLAPGNPNGLFGKCAAFRGEKAGISHNSLVVADFQYHCCSPAAAEHMLHGNLHSLVVPLLFA